MLLFPLIEEEEDEERNAQIRIFVWAVCALPVTSA